MTEPTEHGNHGDQYALQIGINPGSEYGHWAFDDEWGPVRETLEEAEADRSEADEAGYGPLRIVVIREVRA